MDKQLEKQLNTLERSLQELLQAHTYLSDLMEQKRTAMREAKHEQVGNLCKLENDQLRKISDMEKNRLQLVADITLLVAPSAKQPLKLLELSDRLPEPWRGRLLVFRHQLAQKMQETQSKTQSTQQATIQLVKHMTGMMQKVTAACTGSSAYSARGQASTNNARISTFSMTA
ncbi:MAG: flagellar export chaperone FlgN [Phycisphaeraceae bacterium JB051]